MPEPLSHPLCHAGRWCSLDSGAQSREALRVEAYPRGGFAGSGNAIGDVDASAELRVENPELVRANVERVMPSSIPLVDLGREKTEYTYGRLDLHYFF